MTLDELNQLDVAAAGKVFTQCCAAQRWVQGMVQVRPFHDESALFSAADAIWNTMTEADWREAFLAHPQIGNVNTLREKFANTKALAAGEQASVQVASEATLQALATGNQDYLEKFGFIFIVFATGKSAADMLALLQARLPNSREQELRNAALEQHKITRLRLEKLLAATGSAC